MLRFVKKLKEKIAKTKNNFIGKIAEAINLRGKVDEDLLEELEEILIQADIGVDLSIDIIDKLRAEIRIHKITETKKVQEILEEIIRDILVLDYSQEEDKLKILDRKPFIIMFVGVNGVGKTTSIGKLAKRYKDEGKSVIIIAADTFRAAAIEQLAIWADRANVPMFKQEQGNDPASVVYNGIAFAVNKNADIVLIDTAGRLHNKVNLMKELGKIDKTIKKIVDDGPHETLLVVDATTGQNAISQAKLFNESSNITGIVLTKLDGTAKGGIVIGIKHQLKIPVKLIGIGETPEDLRDFNAEEFATALFEK